MIKKNTERGFACYWGEDNNGQEFTLQKSSSALEDKIWLGLNEPDIVERGWNEDFPHRARTYTLPENVSASARMHLTQDQVRELIPILQHFVDTGELP